jgi:hypothetical protein
MDIEEVSAHLEIRQVLGRYCRGVDRRDAELVRSIYYPDAVDDHGLFQGLGVDFADYVVASYNNSNWGFSTHQITNVLIDLSADRRSAGVETYYFAVHPSVDSKTGAWATFTTGGRYLDRFERREAEWKIAQRLCTIDWAYESPSTPPWTDIAKFTRAGNKENDASYKFLSF